MIRAAFYLCLQATCFFMGRGGGPLPTCTRSFRPVTTAMRIVRFWGCALPMRSLPYCDYDYVCYCLHGRVRLSGSVSSSYKSPRLPPQNDIDEVWLELVRLGVASNRGLDRGGLSDFPACRSSFLPLLRILSRFIEFISDIYIDSPANPHVRHLWLGTSKL